MTPIKGWAVVRSDHGDKVVSVNLTQYQAWIDASAEEGYSAAYLERSGYRCIPVTIQEARHDER